MNFSSDEDTSWSNDICVQAALKNFFPTAVKNIDVQKTIVTKFLNFYLGGKIQKGLSVTDIVFAAISIMPLHDDTEEFIWKDEHYGDHGTLFFLTPEDKLNAEVNASTDKTAGEVNGSSKDQLAAITDDEAKKINDTLVQIALKILDSGNSAMNDENVVKIDFGRNTKGSSSSRKDPSESESNNVIREGESTSTSHKQHIQEKQQSGPKNKDMCNELPQFVGTIQWLGKKTETVIEDTRIDYGPVQNAAFTNSCNKLLEVWDTNPKARMILKYFFGVVGLTLMRGTTKSYVHLVDTFSGTRFRAKAISFLQNHFLLSYSTPHKKCIKSSQRTFNRKEGNVRLMFAKIIVNSFFIDNAYVNKPPGLTSIQWNIFKIVVLTHTADYGFGLVSMLRTVLSKIGQNNINVMIKATYCKDTANSWRRLVNFLDKYMSETSKETTHHWARIIDPSYFKYLTCPNNYPLAVILAVFIEKETKDAGIWKSTWVEKDENTNKYKELGLAMYKKFEILREKELKNSLNFLKKFMVSKNEKSNLFQNFTTEFEMDLDDVACEVDDLNTDFDEVNYMEHHSSNCFDDWSDNENIDHWFE